MPKIEQYSFGEIIIDGKAYHDDVIILADRVISSWWRKEGHSLVPEDLEEVLAADPEIFIMGCGAYGALHVPEPTRAFLKSNHIELIATPTPEAVEKYRQMSGHRVACGLHLTC